MIDRIAHRGPDAEGVWSHTDDAVSVHLGPPAPVDHRRARHQQPAVREGRPACSPTTARSTTSVELRAELEALGATFRTTGDTEVVLEAWRHWGPAALPRLRGMFAFALYDERTPQDGAGPRPLRHQAALRRPPRQRRGVRQRAQGAHPGHRPHRDRRRRRGVVAHVLLDPRAALRGQGRREAAAGPLGRDPARPAAGDPPLLRPDDATCAPTASSPPTTSPTSWRTRSASTSSPTCRCRASCRAGSTPAYITALAPEVQPEHRRLHDQLPGRGRQARGDARRPALRQDRGAALRREAQRHRDRARTS